MKTVSIAINDDNFDIIQKVATKTDTRIEEMVSDIIDQACEMIGAQLALSELIEHYEELKGSGEDKEAAKLEDVIDGIIDQSKDFELEE
jgi:uncharacterized iron-regulated protein